MVRSTRARRYTHDLAELKAWASELLDESEKEHLTGDSDYIDHAVIGHVRKINENENLVTTGSCSGHGGNPFISVVFKDDVKRDYYVARMREAGFDVQVSSPYRMNFFKMNFKTPVHEEVSFGNAREVTSARGSRAAWEKFAEILGPRPPSCGDLTIRDIIEKEMAPVKERMRQRELADRYRRLLEERAAAGDETAKEMLQQEKFEEEVKREERRVDRQMRKARKEGKGRP